MLENVAYLVSAIALAIWIAASATELAVAQNVGVWRKVTGVLCTCSVAIYFLVAGVKMLIHIGTGS